MKTKIGNKNGIGEEFLSRFYTYNRGTGIRGADIGVRGYVDIWCSGVAGWTPGSQCSCVAQWLGHFVLF